MCTPQSGGGLEIRAERSGWKPRHTIRGTVRLALALLLAAMPAAAAIPNLPVESLRERAAVIVTGDITGYTAEKRAIQHGKAIDFKISVRVVAVEKGTPRLNGKTIEVRGYNLEYDRPVDGHDGHRVSNVPKRLRDLLPESRSSVIRGRFYLEIHESRYVIVDPNGVEIITRTPKAGK
jgi:hypothetical protein